MPVVSDGHADAPATPDDVDAICRALPGVEIDSPDDRPTYRVRARTFVHHRQPHRNAVDPAGAMYADLLVIHTVDATEKQALVADGHTPFFTIDHFDGYNAVLVQLSRLGEITRAELTEVITDAWLSRAPKSLANAYLADG